MPVVAFCGSGCSSRCMETQSTTTTANQPEPFIPQEIAWQLPGRGWQRRTVRTEAAMDRLLDRIHQDGDVTVMFRDAD